MTTLDTTIPAEVVTILAEYGKDVTFTVESGVTYNPGTGSTTASSSADYTVKSAPPYNYARQFINGSTILEGDARLLIAPPSGWTPDEGMKVVFDSTTWRVVTVRPYYSGESIAAYELQIRQ